jgi:drug/metabolite transporter (DMT)-like permease
MQTVRVTPLPAEPTQTGLIFALLLLVDSGHYIFARALLPYFDPVWSATGVLAVATVQIGVYAAWRGRLHLRALREHFWFLASVGFLVGASTALSYTAVAYIDAGAAAMLAKTSILFSIILGVVWLRERIRPVQLVGGGLALIGMILVTFQPGDLLRFGSLLVLGATAMYALHAALVKRYGQTMDFMDFFFGRLFFTTLTLFLIALTRPPAAAPPAVGWLILVAAGTVDVTISRTLYYQALRRLTMSLHAIILTISPVATLVWSFLLFSSFPAPYQLAGGIIVLIGVAIAAFGRAR